MACPSRCLLLIFLFCTDSCSASFHGYDLVFQPTGSDAPRALLTNAQGKRIERIATKQFTACVFSYLKEHSDSSIIDIFSFSSQENKEVNEIILEIDVSSETTNLYIHGNRASFNNGPSMNKWTHICVAWDSNTGAAYLYINGKAIPTDDRVQKGYIIGGNGYFILGQDQDSYNGGFDPKDGVHGKLTQFNLWSRILTEAEVQQSFACKLRGDVVNWENSIWELMGGIKKEPSEAPCQTDDRTVCTYLDCDNMKNLIFNNTLELIKQRTEISSLQEKTSAIEEKIKNFKPGTSIATSSCGDWSSYKDEDCIILVEKGGTQTKEDAERVCQSFTNGREEEQVPKLVTIKTEEKQEFIRHLLFENRATYDNVWLGLEMTNDSAFTWNDGTDLFFNNWAKQNDSNPDRHCVQMVSDESVYKAGQWVRINCKKRNAVVCERSQSWTVPKLQNNLQNLKLGVKRNRKEYKELISSAIHEMETSMNSNISVVKRDAEQQSRVTNEEMDKKIDSLKRDSEQKINSIKQETEQKFNTFKQESNQKIIAIQQEFDNRFNEFKKSFQGNIDSVNNEVAKKIEHISRNMVPVGFIYVEIPGQLPPTTLWPHYRWQDVSNKYAGQFFRVLGGNSAQFGQVQEGIAPRLEQVEQDEQLNIGKTYPEENPVRIPADGSWSKYFWDGQTGGRNIYMRFRLSNTEVRPRNQAVRVWARIN